MVKEGTHQVEGFFNTFSQREHSKLRARRGSRCPEQHPWVPARALGRAEVDPPHGPVLPSQTGHRAPVLVTLTSCHDLSPKVFHAGAEEAAQFVAHLWKHLPWKGFGRYVNVPNCSLFTPPFASAILHLHIHIESHVCSGTPGSQVDDYPIFMYKEPSAFPTTNAYRSQVTQVTDFASTIKKLLKKRMRFSTASAHMALDSDGGYIRLPSAVLPPQSPHTSRSGTSSPQTNRQRGDMTCLHKANPSSLSPSTLGCGRAEQVLECSGMLMLQVKSWNPYPGATLCLVNKRMTLIAPQSLTFQMPQNLSLAVMADPPYLPPLKNEEGAGLWCILGPTCRRADFRGFAG